MSATLSPVRPATPADLSALLELIQSAYRGESSRRGWTTEADLLDGSRTDAEMLGATLADPATTVLVLDDTDDTDTDTAAGLLACCAVTDRGGGVAEFGTFAVRPSAQGVGTGSRLLAAAVEHAQAIGAARLEMSVLAQRTELLAWYGRRGFRPTGETRPFPYGNERYGRPRRDDLVFTVLAAPLR